MLAYGEKVFGLDRMLAEVGDRREKPQFPTRGVVVAGFLMQLCRLGSLNALEQMKGRSVWRQLSDCPLPSADTMGYVYERIECDQLRKGLIEFYKKVRRSKALGTVLGFKAAVVDAHELTASYKRCCEECSARMVHTAQGDALQYYQRVATLQLLGDRSQFLLDFELERRGEDEVAAAMRLIRRVTRNAPRAFAVLLLDSLYAKAPVVRWFIEHHKEVVIVLKDQHRDLLQDARGLFQTQPPKEFTMGRTLYQQWDLEGFTTWPEVGRPMRVVRSLETTTRRERVGNEWKNTIQTRDWVRTTTLSRNQASTETIVTLGHARWRIENQAFNEMCTFWHLDHIYRHHPNAILGFLLTLALAFNLFHLFWARNLKPQLCVPYGKMYWSDLIAASFRLLCFPHFLLHPP